MEMGNFSRRQQPDKRAEKSLSPTLGLLHRENIQENMQNVLGDKKPTTVCFRPMSLNIRFVPFASL